MALSLKVDHRLSDDDIIWRYMDLARFVSLLDKKAIWLARADTFRDQQEGRFPDDMRKLIEQAYLNLKGTDENSPIQGPDDFQDFLVKNTFICSWHKNLDENMVMWEIYGREKSAVAVQSTVGHLARSMDTSGLSGHSLILKEVIYQHTREIKGALPYEECFFRKRPHFAFEKEVRLSLDTYSTLSPSKDTPMGYYLPVSLNNFVVSVVVHPDCDLWFYDAVVAIATKFNVHTLVATGEYGHR